VLLGGYVVNSLIFSLLGGLAFFVALGCWILTTWLSYVNCAGCCAFVFPSSWRVSGRHGVAGA
jgi:hypothetical protein